MQDLDALDPLHRLHRLADDRLGLLHQPHPERRHPRLRREHVVRVVHQAQRLGLDLGPHPHRHRADLVGVGIGLGLGPDRRAAVGAGFLLGARRAGQAQGLALGRLARADQLDRLLPLGHLDLARGEHLLLGGDCVGPRRVGGCLGDALRLAFLRDRDRPLLLGELERHAPLDLGGLDSALLADSLLLDRLLGADPRRVDRLLGRDLRALALLLALRPLGLQLGALAGAGDLDLALLAEARVLALAVDLERELFRLEVLVADRDQRVLLDVVPLLLALLDRLGQPRQALGVEGVARVEELHAGLVELGQRHRFELEAVLGQVLGHRLAHPRT